ncbi:MAG: hypothetical protein R6V77_01110 [Candidatus Cloacimonadaceae bacterium]
MLMLLSGMQILCSLEPLPTCNPFLISAGGLTVLTDNPAATYLNPAAGDGGISTATSFPYGMTKLDQIELASIVSYQNNSMFVGWQSLDNADYKRQDMRFGIRYSQPNLRVGVGYKLLYDDIPGYGSDKDDRLTAGLRYKIQTLTVDLGSEHNLPFNKDNSFSAGEFSLNLGQQLEPTLLLGLGLHISEHEIADLRVGCRLQLNPNLRGIASWQSEPGRFGLGAVFNIKWLQLAYALQTHPELSWTHSVGITAMFP